MTTILRKLSVAAIIGSTTFGVAANVPKNVEKNIQPDNVILCDSGAACESKTLYGRHYKVITTPRFTVMVAVSHEGIYTRADISIVNHTDMPLPMTPDDFRVEVVTPKPKVLLYVPPANLVLPPPPIPPAPAEPNAGTPTPPTPPPVESAPLSEEKQQALQEAADKAATEQNLEATSIPPNQAAQGRVYFERDKKSHLVNVVLPIAGLVFEFPYAMKK
jgi:pyruvate/2-oxoglutarate dehydrogenase complex dihydrolipoamide acyltransferase (E2) component